MAEHKASSPSQVMVWLGLQFNTVAMTVSLPQDKLAEIQLLEHHWASKRIATLPDLRTFLGKLLYISQVFPSACLFLNRMLDTLRQCPDQGSFTHFPKFHKDLAWFDQFLPTTDGTFIIHQDDRHLVHLYINACMSGALSPVLWVCLTFRFFTMLRQSNLAPPSATQFDHSWHTCRGDIFMAPPGATITPRRPSHGLPSSPQRFTHHIPGSNSSHLSSLGASHRGHGPHPVPKPGRPPPQLYI